MSFALGRASCRLTRQFVVRSGRADLEGLATKASSSTVGSTKAKAKTTMKRSPASSTGQSKPKRPRVELPEYHATPSVKTESGDIIWPAPEDQLEAARSFILDWLESSLRFAET